MITVIIEIYFISSFHFFIDQFFQVYFKLLGILLLSYHLEKPLQDSICRNFIGLMWLDWIGLRWTWLYWIGLECCLFWMALHSSRQHRTTLNRTSLDSPGLHWARNYAWMGLHLSGRDWTVVRATRLDWTRRHCTSLHWIVIDCTWLHQTALHCTVLD